MQFASLKTCKIVQFVLLYLCKIVQFGGEMDKRVLEEVLFDQKEEMANLMQKDFVHRREEAFVDLESHLAQVVIGVRRSGKSILCRNVLKNAGVHFANSYAAAKELFVFRM